MSKIIKTPLKKKVSPQSRKVEGNKTKKWKQKQSTIKSVFEKSRTEEIRKSMMISDKPGNPKVSMPLDSLRDRMLKRLDAARFRLVNEELDSMDTCGDNPCTAFDSNFQHFKKYHESYKERISSWPSDPLNAIIKFIKKKISKDKIVADFGCGEARLAVSVPHKVHSFDLFALNDRVTACNMSTTPLKDQSVDVAVFCLSLMGTEVGKYIYEASRVLKMKGILKIVEVSSRLPENYQTTFVKRLKKFGFVSKEKQVLQKQQEKGVKREEVFLIFEFLKIRVIKQTKEKLPSLKLNPCMYKKR